MHLITLILVTFFTTCNFMSAKSSSIVFRDNNEPFKPSEHLSKKSKGFMLGDHSGINKIGSTSLQKRLYMKEKKPGVFMFQYDGMGCTFTQNVHNQETVSCNRAPCQRNSINVWICERDDFAFSCTFEMSIKIATCMDMPSIRSIITPTTLRPPPLLCPEGQYKAQDGSCRPPFDSKLTTDSTVGSTE